MMESWSELGPRNTSTASFTPCPAPFIAERSIEHNGGFIDGRWCKPIPIDGQDVSCCFPCPITDWRYSSDFTTDMVPWIGLFVLIMMLISLLTYAVLPVSATQRHYLTTAPLMGFVFVTVAWIIPLGPAVQYCYDAITPNDWLSDVRCAFSGSLLLYGVWVVVASCFFRALSLYIQLCWEQEPGPRFRIISLSCIFVGSLALLIVALTVSGASYQVGHVCYVSYSKSLGSFWGPLIAVATTSFALQILVVVYCIRGVLSGTSSSIFASLFQRPSTPSSGLSRPRSSVPRTSARIWNILQLQWRPVSIVLLVLFHVTYVAQVVLRYRDSSAYPYEDLEPWITCLIQTKGDRDGCLPLADTLEPTQGESVAALALLASCGFWGFVCTVRSSMVIAWFAWLRENLDTHLAFLRHVRNSQSSDIERVPSSADGDGAHSLDGMASPTTTLADIDRVYGKREYHVPQNSFSAPGRYTGSSLTTTITSDCRDWK